MSVDERDLRSFIAGYGLNPQQLTATPLEGGGGNLVLLLEADGRKLVLRRYDNAPPDEVEFELRLAQFLDGSGFPTQPPLNTTDGSLTHPLSGRSAALFAYIEGNEPEPGSPATAARLATTIAHMHLVTRDLRLPGSRAWVDLANLDRLEDLARSTGEWLSDPLWPGLVEDCHELRAALDRRVLCRDPELPKGIVHHDLNPGNLLLDSRGEIALMDFCEAQECWLIMDIAGLIRYWGMDGEWEHIEPKKISGLLSIYDRTRPLLDVERDVLPEMLLLFFLGDALGFILPKLAGELGSPAVSECYAYRRFRNLKTDLAGASAL